MRRWPAVAASAAALVADRPALWIPGALAWTVSVGWIPLVVGVADPPTTSELTFLGSGFFSSSVWPWNAVAVGVVALIAAAVALVVGAVAETSLLGMLAGRRLHAAAAFRVIGVVIVSLAPVVATLFALGVALLLVAPREFTSPDANGGPVLRTFARVLPFLASTGIAIAAAGAYHAAATRLAVRPRADFVAALAAAPRLLLAGGAGTLAQAIVSLVVRAAFVTLAAILLRVLWDPIGGRLDVGGFEAGTVALLVGFVAIWLCLVLAGGALHAWGSVTWSLVLGSPATTGTPAPGMRR